MVYWTPIHSILSPYRSDIEPTTDGILNPLPMAYLSPTHGIFTPLSVVLWTPTHDILTPYPWYIEPPIHDILTPYPWYVYPSIQGILIPLPMVFWPTCPWYIDSPHMVYQTLSLDINEGFKLQWRKNDPGVNISYENWPRDQYTMEAKISYDTGSGRNVQSL
jgi:hypothetical protein